jgi:Ankyrin repeats (3 copies)
VARDWFLPHVIGVSKPEPGPLIAGAFAFALSIGMAWCHEHWGTYDPLTNGRQCATPPRAIKQWMSTSPTRRPAERTDLETWVSRNRGSLEAKYTARCQTPLHLAAEFGRDDLAAVLLNGGADPNARDKYGDRPLHLAAEYGNPAVVRLLLARGASLDARGSMDRTPLHAAADGLGGTQSEADRLLVADTLITRGANVNARERGSGFTPLRYATGSRSTTIADLLRENGGL